MTGDNFKDREGEIKELKQEMSVHIERASRLMDENLTIKAENEKF